MKTNTNEQASLSFLSIYFLIDGKLIEVPMQEFDAKIEGLKKQQKSFSYQDNNGFWKHFEFSVQLSDDEERVRQMNS